MKIRVRNKDYTPTQFFEKYVLGVGGSVVSRLLFLNAFLRRPVKNRIVMFGHRRGGNLKAFGDWLQANTDYEVLYMTDDRAYYKRNAQKLGLLSSQNLAHLSKVARAEVICTSHGPMALRSWTMAKNRPLFVDVWHGAGFKDRNPAATKAEFSDYDAVFVSSPTFKTFYERWGIPSSKIYVTGYARTDKLVGSKATKQQRESELKKYGVKTGKASKVVLCAPTWSMAAGGSIFPFGMDGKSFLSGLNDIASKNNALLVFLPHLNSNEPLRVKGYKNLAVLGTTQSIDVEALLRVVDVLITDWSSAYTDFLALKRPCIFLNTPPTFKGFTLKPEDRAGQEVKNMTELQAALDLTLKDDKKYLAKYAKQMERTTKKAWGDTLDGKSSMRYFKAIQEVTNAKN